MRFRTTPDFVAALEEYGAAQNEYSIFDENDKDAEKRAEQRLDEADEALFSFTATTAEELRLKLTCAAERGFASFEKIVPFESISADLRRLQRFEVSPDFEAAWNAWRSHSEVYALAVEATDDPALAEDATEKRDKLYCEIALKACTTPGDFILKQYLRLLTTYGAYDRHCDRDDLTANPWLINLGDSKDEARFERADALGTFNDIDDTDLGRNLLAYGKVRFDGEAWMEAADRVGHEVHLLEQPDGTFALGTLMPATSPSQRLDGERDRLMRIMAEPGEERHRAIADEIRENWPQLVLRRPQPATAAEMHERAAARPAEAEAVGEEDAACLPH